MKEFLAALIFACALVIACIYFGIITPEMITAALASL